MLAGGSIHVTIAPVNFTGLVKGRLQHKLLDSDKANELLKRSVAD